MKKQMFDEIIRLGYACNEKCLFCNYTELNEPGTKHKNFYDVKDEIDNLIEKCKNPQDISIYFSGGEPLLWKDTLIESIKYAKKCNIGHIGIQSNLTILDESYIKILKRAGLNHVLVSLHASNDELNDKITLLKNSFSKTYFGIQLLKKYKINFLVNHVLNKLNYKFLEEFIYFMIHDLNQKKLSLGIVQPHGYAEVNFFEIIPKYEDLALYLHRGFEFAKENKFILITHYCDIPYCKFPRDNYDLNMETIFKIRSGAQDLQVYSKKISQSKIKTSACKCCKYHSYCYGVWKNYLLKIGSDSIKPTDIFLNFSQSDLSKIPSYTEIEDGNFVYHASDIDLFRLQSQVKKGGFIFQLYLTSEDFSLDIIAAIQSGINVINIDILENKVVDVSIFIRLLQTALTYSQSNQPYFSVTIFVKTSNQSLKKLLSRIFTELIII